MAHAQSDKLPSGQVMPMGDEKDKVTFMDEKPKDDEDRIIFPDEYENEKANSIVEESPNLQARNVISVGLKEGYDRDATGRPVKEW